MQFRSFGVDDVVEQRLRFPSDAVSSIWNGAVVLRNTGPCAIAITAVIPERYERLVLVLSIEDAEQRLAMQIMSEELSRPPGSAEPLAFFADLGALPLNSGKYFMHCAIRAGDGTSGLAETLVRAECVASITIIGRLYPGFASVQLPAVWRCELRSPCSSADR